MPFFLSLRFLLLLFLSILNSPLFTTAHMELQWPIPFNSKFDALYYGNSIDWSNTSPLLTDGSNFPCKHYHLQNHNKVQATYTAGGTYNISLTGFATHLGGSCQISLSYDNGQSFQVLKSMVGGCPLKPNWDFTIPADAPSKSDALLAWSWFNLIGNREMYMNCVRVAVNARAVGATELNNSTTRTRVPPMIRRRQKQRQRQKLIGWGISKHNASNVTAAASFGALPSMFACNVGNGCTTVEKREVVFPKLGDVVEYGIDAVVPDPGPGFVITT